MSDAAEDMLYILVIDDHLEMRNLLLRILSPDGHVVIAVDSAEEGLAQLPWNTFQVAFLDQNLPGMEGLVFGEYLRQNNPHMEIALVTGSDAQNLERLTEAQDITLIPKPFQVDQILDVVSSYRKRAAARSAEEQLHGAPDFAPPLSTYLGEMTRVYSVPSVPSRIEDRLVQTVRDSLRNLHSVAHYNERDRVVALSGLISALVLGVKLPKNNQGQTLYEEYDAAMTAHGRRTEFAQDEA